jgi:hypothetical protein
MAAGFALVAMAVQAETDAARQRMFASPEQAAEALFVAVQRGDDGALSQLFGGETELLSSGDEPLDAHDRGVFLVKYRQMHRTTREGGGAILYVGAENWPFPIPLAIRQGSWFFDTLKGREEIRLRRIGANESSVIDLFHSLGGSGQAAGDRVANNQVPLDGYYFRRIAGPAGTPSFVAYPARYGSSGVMTFVVGPQGVVYERDLGASTPKIASAIVRYPVDQSWQALQ